MTKPLELPPMSAEHHHFIVSMLAEWLSVAVLYTRITAETLRAEYDLEPLAVTVWTLGKFRRYCKDIPTEEIATAHDEWKRRFDGIRWAEEKSRVEALGTWIDKLLEAGEDAVNDPDNVASLVKLMEQVRKERNADADRAAVAASGLRILLQANPNNVIIDANTVADLILTFRNEIPGGLSALPYDTLTIEELETLSATIKSTLERKVQAITETEFEITSVPMVDKPMAEQESKPPTKTPDEEQES